MPKRPTYRIEYARSGSWYSYNRIFTSSTEAALEILGTALFYLETRIIPVEAPNGKLAEAD